MIDRNDGLIDNRNDNLIDNRNDNLIDNRNDNLIDGLLDNLNEGIIVIDENLEIKFWNNNMERLTEVQKSTVLGKNIYQVIPNLDKQYFHKTMQIVLDSGSAMFFSAAMHKEILNSKDSLNLKISLLNKCDLKFLLLEFSNVTNQMEQISQLKEYVNELYLLNKELKVKEKVIKNLAYYDNLTGIANRTLFYKIANKYMKNAMKQNAVLGLMFIDIDKFKSINDNFGHVVGDRILVRAANILQSAVRPNDLVARYGGDEFLILLQDIENISECNEILSRINNSKYRFMSYNNTKITISLSIGISFYPSDGNTIDQLMAKADEAMYVTKNTAD